MLKRKLSSNKIVSDYDLRQTIQDNKLEELQQFVKEGVIIESHHLNHACGQSDLSIVEYLFSLNIKCTPRAMLWACTNGKLNVAMYLHSQNIPAYTNCMNAACKFPDLQLPAFLHSISVKPTSSKAMDSAIAIGCLELIQFLHSIDAFLPTNQGVCYAITKGDLPMIKYLVSIDIIIDSYSLECAGKSNQLEILEYLFTLGLRWDRKAQSLDDIQPLIPEEL